ncbi:unnamed protein product [Hydatigera taeniaeformis]|uniref:Transposase n=1 Tax=Hydatigena taeniaeformis TaxID=6205 RepID=A0A0R3WNP8_HYDTA|nr:unnamed protein product [Hydatigera taeniaeformis]
MEYAKQGPYISKVIYYQTIDDTEPTDQTVRIHLVSLSAFYLPERERRI